MGNQKRLISISSNRPLIHLGLIVLALSGVGACKKQSDPKQQESSKGKAPTGPSAAFSIGPQTEGALFTWVDDQGSFQITEDPSTIPQGSQKQVRVVVDGKSVGSAEYVYVADLTEVNDGSYSLLTMPRSEWESLGKAKREQRIKELTPKEEPSATSQLADLGLDAIIYGADWCKPCHLAEDYLKSKGAKVIKKDIEEDPGAASEMRAVLKSAGLSGSSIPVLNVGGTVLRGFSAKAIDKALKNAKKQP